MITWATSFHSNPIKPQPPTVTHLLPIFAFQNGFRLVNFGICSKEPAGRARGWGFSSGSQPWEQTQGSRKKTTAHSFTHSFIHSFIHKLLKRLLGLPQIIHFFSFFLSQLFKPNMQRYIFNLKKKKKNLNK